MKKPALKTLALILCGISWIAAGTTPAVSQTSKSQDFKIDAAPTAGDWHRFHIMTQPEQSNLWTSYEARNLGLGAWSWQWRLAWVRVCADSSRWSWCQKILEAGLIDDAVVVRAEAATQYAKARTGQSTAQDVAILVKSYNRKDNFRNGKPLFVCERILSALNTLNTPAAKTAAKKLASRDKQTLAYWKALTRAEQKKM